MFSKILDIVLLGLLGIIAIRLLIAIIRILYHGVIGPSINKVNFKSLGRWALVTGATDGIGKEYARQLAARGCDIILVSRSLDKLKSVAGEIEKEFPVATKVVQADFKKDNIYDGIAKELEGLEIGTLVNNVGMFYPYPEYFLDVPNLDTVILDMLNVNTLSMMKMTALVLPGMVKRKKGVVINVSSIAAISPPPFFTVYAATKAFMDKFTMGLQQEYKRSGVFIQCVSPGLVITNMSRSSMGEVDKSLFSPTAEEYVRSALRTVGTSSRTAGYIGHTIVVWFTEFCNWIGISEYFGLKVMEGMRKESKERYYKNKEQ